MTYTGLNVKCTKIQPWPIWKYINNNKWPMGHIAKTEQTWIPFTNSAVEIGPLFLEKKFLNFVNVFLLFLYHLPFRKKVAPSFEETWIPFTQGCFVPSFVEIGPVVLEKKMKMWKVYRRTDGRQVIRKAHLSFQPRWAKNIFQKLY